MRRLFGIMSTVAVMACGSTTAPTPNLSGDWSGTIFSTQSGSGALAFTLTQSTLPLLPPGNGYQIDLHGPWSITFPPTANGVNAGGLLSGTISGPGLSLAFMPTIGSTCPFRATAALNGSRSMTGTYEAYDCSVALSGSFAATRQ